MGAVARDSILTVSASGIRTGILPRAWLPQSQCQPCRSYRTPGISAAIVSRVNQHLLSHVEVFMAKKIAPSPEKYSCDKHNKWVQWRPSGAPIPIAL